MHRLHTECVVLHKERTQLVEKLTNIQNAQQLINSIGDEVNQINNGTNSDNVRADEQPPSPSLDPVSGLSAPNIASNPKVIQNISTKDMNILRFKATEAIEKTKQEKEELEFELNDKEGKLAHMKHQLDEYRDSLVDQQNDDRADTHFATNGTVLRGAYQRFRSAIKERLKYHHIGNVITAVDNDILRRKYWHLWEFYMRKRMMMHYHVRRRKQALVLLTWEQWRLYTVLELHVRRRGRKNILMRYFRSWKEDLVDHTEIIPVARNVLVSTAVGMQLGRRGAVGGVRGVHQAKLPSGSSSAGSDGWIVVHKTAGFYDNIVSLFQERSLKRKLFANWKKICVNTGRLWPAKSGISSSAAYLPWDTEEINQLEAVVQPLLVKKGTIFRHWARVTRESSESFGTLSNSHVPLIRMKKFFHAWRGSCIQLWSHRSKLVYRFFSNATALVERSYQRRRDIKCALSFYADNLKRQGLRTWFEYSQKKSQYSGVHSLTSGISSRFGVTVSASATDYLRRDVREVTTGTELGSTFAQTSTQGFSALLAASELSSSYFPLNQSATGSPGTPFQSPRKTGNTISFAATAPESAGKSLMTTGSTRHMVSSRSAPTLSSTHSNVLTRPLSFRNIKLMKQALRSWHVHSIINQQRQNISTRLAERYHTHMMLGIKGLQVWRQHTKNEIRYRRLVTKKLFDDCFTLWREYAVQIRQEKGFLHKMRHYRRNIEGKNLHICWNHWRTYNSYQRRCNRTATIIQSRARLSTLRTAFVKVWKQQWCHHTFWKVGELRIENKKIQDLITLYNNELALADREKESLVTASNNYQQQIVEYTQQLVDKEYALQEQEAKNQQSAKQIKDLKEQLGRRSSSLQDIQDERNRLVVVEEVSSSCGCGCGFPRQCFHCFIILIFLHYITLFVASCG